MENQYIQDTEQGLLKTYNRFPVVLDHGEGMYLYDTDGKKYLDFAAGIAVCGLGYGNQEFGNAIKSQVDKLLHTSNLYYNTTCGEAARELKRVSQMDRVFFTNSGTEAVEGALKAARKYAYEKKSGRYEFIAMEDAFHGRSIGAVSVTGHKEYREPFEPMLPGVSFATFNDLDSVKALVSEKTCAIIMETIQGEGGINPATPEFLNGVRKICDENDILLILDLIIDNTDRNRTSPFAFTGNRFEFRAPGSAANCASAMIALNAAMAEALVSFKERVDALINKGENKISAILDVLREDIRTCKPVRFDGNGYSDEWVEEARQRGLDVEKSCPIIFERYLDESSVRMFEQTKVMNRKELEARNEVKWEMYVKTVQIEARVLGDLAMNHIIPVSTHYQSKLIKNVQGMKDVFSAEKADRLSSRNMKLIEEIAERTEKI